MKIEKKDLSSKRRIGQISEDYGAHHSRIFRLCYAELCCCDSQGYNPGERKLLRVDLFLLWRGSKKGSSECDKKSPSSRRLYG